MALIKCYECSKEISDKAKSCPYCKSHRRVECHECRKLVSDHLNECSNCGAPKKEIPEIFLDFGKDATKSIYQIIGKILRFTYKLLLYYSIAFTSLYVFAELVNISHPQLELFSNLINNDLSIIKFGIIIPLIISLILRFIYKKMYK